MCGVFVFVYIRHRLLNKFKAHKRLFSDQQDVAYFDRYPGIWRSYVSRCVSEHAPRATKYSSPAKHQVIFLISAVVSGDLHAISVRFSRSRVWCFVCLLSGSHQWVIDCREKTFGHNLPSSLFSGCTLPDILTSEYWVQSTVYESVYQEILCSLCCHMIESMTQLCVSL